ncbi:cytochrome C biogenesis protein [bacterium]|jgi:cytochrome c-type biogenesis protein|nr:cytochrome C biogenesis protein [bacterium]MDP6571324.1 cytochrome c biogenesis protein CcdA [Patescibacteria group bacterium]MDP6756225.1 cytochrome c biogenesis protein CcdA [Patescibacteria group bacterium]|tara:strand:- start:40811 stop:41569 length:759 start_codon:yes stop_codon:yes gene_type:complete
MDFSLIIPSFIAGILTFLAPCTLPLVPGYLAFISGTSLQDLQDPLKAPMVKHRIFVNGVFFVLGFSALFIIFGALLGLLGAELATYRIWLTRIGGILVIFFGLFVLGLFKLTTLESEHRLKLPSFLMVGRKSSSFLMGSAFAVGWSPCVGPILGAILVLASTTATVAQGAILLSVFSAGLAIPFLLVALGIGKATQHIQKLATVTKWVSIIGGIFLVGLGILLLTNNMALLISWGFQLLEFLNYEELIIDHL